MIAQTNMRRNLVRLNSLYNKAQTPIESLFFSKLAILDLCGWIEESMDDVVRRCAIRCLHVADNRKFVEKEVIKKTYGFDYDSHFRKMLGRVIGLMNVEKLERRLDTSVHTKFVATLSTLKTSRDSEAHTHLKGATKVLNAPSVTLAQFEDVYKGLTAYDSALRKYIA
jgi:hypothetical protein